MKKEIFINSSISETRIAILEDGKLVELFVERPENERMVGDIYLGKVVNVMKGMQAAFVDIGQGQDAFLHFSDIGETFREYGAGIDYDEDSGRSTLLDKDLLRENQEILVQIIKEPINSKGSRITTEISLAGRFLVLVPNQTLMGVSKKITSHREKRRLRKIARTILHEGFGLIIRTVAEGKDQGTLKADLDSLLKAWKKIEKKVQKARPPTLIHKDMGMASSIIRDLFTPDVTRLVADSRPMIRDIKNYLKN